METLSSSAPGIEGQWNQVQSGGNASQWLPLLPLKLFTNAFVWSEAEGKASCYFLVDIESL